MVRARDNSTGEAPAKKESSSTTRGSKATSSVKKKNGSTGVWPCKINGCTKQFAREADLKRHQRTTKLHATSVAGSQCPQCDATFTRTDALRRHQKSRHNGVVIDSETFTYDDDRDDSTSDPMEYDDEEHSGNSGSSSPSLMSPSEKDTRKYRKMRPDQSPTMSSYQRPVYTQTQPRTIKDAPYTTQNHLSSSFGRGHVSPEWDRRVGSRYNEEDSESSSDDDDDSQVDMPAETAPRQLATSYPGAYYTPQYSTSSTASMDYYNMHHTIDKKPRANGYGHWKTSSDRDMSLGPSETAVPPSAGGYSDVKMHGNGFGRERGGYACSASSSREGSIDVHESGDAYSGGIASRYQDATSLRSTLSDYSYYSRPSLRQQDSATRSTVMESSHDPRVTLVATS
ncbi:hypothetical protein DL96DRAFT_18379 [Flagelloscypha sp. PMI_526]|nr:hypothetical protein DL96DRAFT_18379 [Flagelloscypha sp. PMI_526]